MDRLQLILAMINDSILHAIWHLSATTESMFNLEIVENMSCVQYCQRQVVALFIPIHFISIDLY